MIKEQPKSCSFGIRCLDLRRSKRSRKNNGGLGGGLGDVFVSAFRLVRCGLRESGILCKDIGQITGSCSWGAVSAGC